MDEVDESELVERENEDEQEHHSEYNYDEVKPPKHKEMLKLVMIYRNKLRRVKMQLIVLMC